MPQGVVEAVGSALAAGSSGGAGSGLGVLDARAGRWDPTAGDLLLRLGLWCCAESPDARPMASVVAGELARLLRAVEAVRAALNPASSNHTQPQHRPVTPG